MAFIHSVIVDELEPPRHLHAVRPLPRRRIDLFRGWLAPRVGPAGSAPLVRPPASASVGERIAWLLIDKARNGRRCTLEPADQPLSIRVFG